ncbi:MAG: ribbon-helix-helix protein, CopG family [Candidatus Omnitrophica bacterium]|nr:ribbon-helix-helix protein, CopG family [Candidatus Omnitrophota bacterium]
MPVEHLNITLPVDLKEALDHEAEREHTKRSTLIQKAVALYLRVAEKTSLRELLKEGYVEMASEARAVTRAFQTLDREALKYVD